MTRLNNTVTRRATYRRGRNLGLAAGLFLGSCAGFIIGLTTHVEASTYECKSFREILEGFEYDYNPRYEAPPMKPTI